MDRNVYVTASPFDGGLERVLESQIRRWRKDDPLRSIQVVAPSARWVRHLKITASRWSPAGMFGVRFLNIFQFAYELAGTGPRKFQADSILFERILLGWLRGSEWGRSVPVTYGFAGAVRAAIRDLKDSSLTCDPGAVLSRLREVVRLAHEGEIDLTAYDLKRFGILLEAYRHYEAELDRIGKADMPDVFRMAAENAALCASPVIFHGFYDMTQVQADCVSAVSRHVPIVLIIPHEFDRPEDWRFNAWFRETFAPSVARSAKDGEAVLASPDSSVYRPSMVAQRGSETDGTARDSVAPPAPLIRNAAGERDEIWGCAKEIRRLLDSGAPPREIALTARSLDPYLRWVREIFRDHCIPIADPPALPLQEHPLARVLLHLFHLSASGFPRDAVLSIIRHPLFGSAGPARHWEYLVDVLRIRREEDWTRLRDMVGEDYEVQSGGRKDEDRRVLRIPKDSIRSLYDAFSRTTQPALPERGPWRSFTRTCSDLLSLFDWGAATEDEAQVREAVSAILRRLGDLDDVEGEVTRDDFLATLDRECDRARMQAVASTGVSFLDAMGIRGLSFDYVFTVGLNAHAFPRFIVEEPFISDAVRQSVLRAYGHHLPVRRDGYDEERLLFRLIQAAVRKQWVCYFQRSDSKGRHKDPSPFLRPWLKGDVQVTAVPRGLWARLANGEPLTPSERTLVVPDPAAWLRAFGRDPDLMEGSLECIRELEGRQAGAFDGVVGEGRIPSEFSPTGMERYALCPFKYFAADVLRLFPFEEVDEEDDLSRMELGRLLHGILERLFRALEARGFRSDDLEKEVEEASRAACAEFEAGLRVPLTGLRAVRATQAARYVLEFSRWELAHLAPWVPVRFEAGGTAELGGVRFRGRMDRIDRNPDGLHRVIDYKLRRSSAWEGKLGTKAKRGEKLQPPVYLACEGAAEARFVFVSDFASRDPSITRLETVMSAEEWRKVRDEVEQTIRIFADSIRSGFFFVRPDDSEHGHCRSCEYSGVCRKRFGAAAEKARTCAPAYWKVVG